jgi:hypothetical protein
VVRPAGGFLVRGFGVRNVFDVPVLGLALGLAWRSQARQERQRLAGWRDRCGLCVDAIRSKRENKRRDRSQDPEPTHHPLRDLSTT